MKFGYFDDANKEYVITSPKTPLPWINYLGSENFFSLISNTCGGYSFYKDAKLLRLTRYRYNNVPFDSNGHYYYIKEGDTIWNPGWMPAKTDLDAYECHHGMGYSTFRSSKNDLQAELTAFVPVGKNCEINQLTLTNNSNETKDFSVFSYVEFCLWNAMDVGFYVQKGNPKGITGWQDLARDDLTILNRRPGSSSRILLDVQLKKLGISSASLKGYDHIVKSHLTAAAAVAEGEADLALGTERISTQIDGIDFIPLLKESYDLVVRKSLLETSVGQKLEEVLVSPIFHRELAHFTGNDYRDLGKIIEEV